MRVAAFTTSYPRGPRVLYAGRLSPEKGIEELIAATRGSSATRKRIAALCSWDLVTDATLDAYRKALAPSSALVLSRRILRV